MDTPVDGSGLGGDDAGAATLASPEERYRHMAAALEAFIQTSTIGEFEARLRLLDSFHDHLSARNRLHVLLRRQQQQRHGGGSGEGGAQELRQDSARIVVESGSIPIFTAEGGLPLDLSIQTASALANTVRYYRQFSPSVRKAIEMSLTPLEKDLQVCVEERIENMKCANFPVMQSHDPPSLCNLPPFRDSSH